MTKAEWSGWAQAIFSVVAILAAILIAYFQNQHAHRALKQSRVAAAHVARGAMIIFLWDVSTALMHVREIWDQQKDECHPSFIARQLAGKLENLTFPTESQLLCLAEVWPDATHLVALANAQTQSALTRIKSYAVDGAYSETALKGLVEGVVGWVPSLEERFLRAESMYLQ